MWPSSQERVWAAQAQPRNQTEWGRTGPLTLRTDRQDDHLALLPLEEKVHQSSFIWQEVDDGLKLHLEVPEVAWMEEMANFTQDANRNKSPKGGSHGGPRGNPAKHGYDPDLTNPSTA